jgi:hypothetical protein
MSALSRRGEHSLDDRLAMGFSRLVTRRTLLRRALRVAAGGAAAASAGLAFPGRAQAIPHCSFAVGTWGCYCASTPSCGGSKCCATGGSNPDAADTCCGGAQRRCNYWTSSPYCWCSRTCCIGGRHGYYSCCDCWKYGQSGGCGSGNTKCICKGRVDFQNC